MGPRATHRTCGSSWAATVFVKLPLTCAPCYTNPGACAGNSGSQFGWGPLDGQRLTTAYRSSLISRPQNAASGSLRSSALRPAASTSATVSSAVSPAPVDQ